MHYQEKLDQIFAKGDHWKHRTLRTVFDVGSHEYTQTTKAEKIDVLKTCVQKGLSLAELIDEYRAFYESQKIEASSSIEFVVIDLLTETLKSQH